MNQDRLRRVGIVAVPPVRTIDVFGPAEVFTDANRQLGETAYEVEVVAGTAARAVEGYIGKPVFADRTFLEPGAPLDTLLVAGGPGVRETRYPPELLDWLKEQSNKVRRLGSICTGALVLAETGLLDGRRATTHWHWCADLRKHARVKVDPDPIYIRDGNIYTSAGVTAGIDLALALVEEDLGPSIALRVAQMMVVFLHRPGGQSQFSVTLAAQAAADRRFHDLLAWIADHIGRDLSIAALARRAAMSPRNFARVFTREVGETPAGYIERLRIEAVRRQLEATSANLEEIADLSGFKSSEVLRRAFARHLGTTPGRYRAAFGSAKARR